MSAFFKGWRRKIGCVTLVTATVFLAAWGRSHVSADKLILPRGGGIQYLAKLSPSGISLAKIEDLTLGPSQNLWLSESGPSVIVNSAAVVGHPVDSSNTTELEHEASGEQVVPMVGPVSIVTEVDLFEVPYWYLITPLTLLSACLLLWPSRRKSQVNSVFQNL